jgi:hypothetical protein
MITLSIYKKMIKQCGDIRNLHKAVKTLWQIVERRDKGTGTVSRVLEPDRMEVLHSNSTFIL